MTQEHKFSMREQERIDGLTNLLIDILPKNGVIIQSCGAWRDGFGNSGDIQTDSASYSLFMDKQQIGHYKFVKKGIYTCELDLTGLPEDKYKIIVDSIKREFPEIKLD